jgi:stage II sporulation protein D
MAEHERLDTWQVKDGAEPVIRVGIVLDTDAAAEVRLDAFSGACSVWADGAPASGKLRRACRFAVDGDGVSMIDPKCTPARAGLWRITPPREDAEAEQGGVLVHDVVAGRGFHWEKRIEQRLGGTIEIRRSERGIVLINELPLERYLAGVITAEMNEACPLEMLKAQCAVARSWTLAQAERKHVAEGFDLCNDDCCQRYQGTGNIGPNAARAVTETRGMVLMTPDGAIVDANYAKSCGGITESPENVWGFRKPGLSPVVDAPSGSRLHTFLPVTERNIDEFLDGAWLADTDAYCGPHVVPTAGLTRYLGKVDESAEYFRWDVTYSRQEMENLLCRGPSGLTDLGRFHDLRVTRRGVSGRALEIEIEYDNRANRRQRCRVSSEYAIRQILSRRFLFSSAFAARIERDADGAVRQITLRGAGWGHGAGLCQIGALGMALGGRGCHEILRHYFPDADIARVYG